jgi:hypothetical protein
MSVVTDIMVCCICGQEDIIPEFNEWLEKQNQGHLVRIDMRSCGGGKHFQQNIYAGAYNHLNAEAFFEFVLALKAVKTFPYTDYFPLVLMRHEEMDEEQIRIVTH